MWAARITLAHLSTSSVMSLPNSAGEPLSGVPPKSANRAFSLGLEIGRRGYHSEKYSSRAARLCAGSVLSGPWRQSGFSWFTRSLKKRPRCSK